MGFAIKSKDHYDSRVGKRIPTNVVLIRSGGPELSWGLLRPFPNLLKVKVTSARPIKTQCTFVGRIIVEVTFQEAHLLSIILCLPFVLQTRRNDNCSNPNGPRDLYLFLRLNRSMKNSNGGRFFAFCLYHCILNERISGGIKEADPSVTCVRSIAEYAWVHLLTAVVRIIVDCIATKFHLENCKFSLCSTTQYPCLMWYTVSQSHSVTKSNLDVYVIVNCLPSCKLMKYKVDNMLQKVHRYFCAIHIKLLALSVPTKSSLVLWESWTASLNSHTSFRLTHTRSHREDIYIFLRC